MKRLTLLLFIVGCASASPLPAAEPAPAAATVPSCEEIFDHVTRLVYRSSEYQSASGQQQVQLRERLELEKRRSVARCDDPNSPQLPEQRQCIVAATSVTAAQRCGDLAKSVTSDGS